MSREVKIVLGLGVAVVLLCGIACVSMYLIGMYTLPKVITSDQEQAAKIGHEIADYTLPPGYYELVAMNVLGAKWVVIGQDNSDALVIMLMQFPAGSNMSQEEMEQQMTRSLAQQNQGTAADFEIVGTEKVTIRGQQVTLTTREGQSSSDPDINLRQVVGVLPGPDNIVMLMAMGMVKEWDETAFDSFLASIR